MLKHYALKEQIQWNLPYLDLYYLGTSIVQTAQIGLVACSLLTMKFGLDESTWREPKGCCLPVRWLVYSTYCNYHLVGRITHFLQPRGGTMNVLW